MTTTASIDFQTKIALVQCGVRKLNDTVFYAPSETERADHVVTVNPETGLADYCTCEWYARGGWTRVQKDGSSHKCAHALAVEAYIREERAAQEAPVAEVEVEVESVDVVAQAEEVLVQATREQPAEVTYTVQVGYVRVAGGGVVRKEAQVRTRERGAFSLYR